MLLQQWAVLWIRPQWRTLLSGWLLEATHTATTRTKDDAAAVAMAGLAEGWQRAGRGRCGFGATV